VTAAAARHVIAVLRASQERLRALVEPLDGETLRAPSYDDGWPIAQVLSHLGSQAELMDGYLVAALTGGEAPDRAQFPAVWAAWDSRPPEEQRAASLAMNDRHIGRMEECSDEALERLHLSLFGVFEVDAAGFARLRLNEHALHTWDIAVALDPGAAVAPDAVSLLVDSAADSTARLGKPQGKALRVCIETTDPERSFLLVVAGDGVSVGEPPEQGDDGRLRLPAEAFLRLVFGRLDPAHTPPVELDAPGVTLDDLRAVFPGI
jgi:uncharacterized protein (TIGR03083 family)